MRFSNKLASLTLLAAMLAGPTVGMADELNMTTPPQSSANRPARGMSMEKVEAVYGAPSKREPAIGEPPITRWEYPDFVVYFEHQYVIHAVGVIG
jgi:hypothetical protein